MPGPDVQVEVAPGYELVLSLTATAGGTPTTAAIRARAPELCSRVVDFAPSAWMWAHLATVAYDAPAPRDAAAFLTRLDRTPALELQRRLVGYHVRWFRHLTPVDVMDAALAGNATASETFARTSGADNAQWEASVRARLAAGPRESKRELLDIVERWHDEVFTPLLEPTLPALERAVRSRRRRVGTGVPGDRVVALTGWSFVAEPGITRILVVPSAVLGSELHEFDHGPLQFLCVGLGSAAGRTPAVPREVLAVSRALADESRVRIVRQLAQADAGAQELADAVGVSLNTALHHLRALREAGLVGRGGRRQPYRLRRSRLASFAKRLTDL